MHRLLNLCAKVLYLYYMKTSQKIEIVINTFNDGVIFNYQQLSIEAIEFTAAAKAIERLIDREIIKRVSNGVFYKPKKTVFGALKPNEEELLKSYLYQNNQRIAYVTGTSLYNRLRLTTQIPTIIKIASRDKRITINTSNIIATPIKAYVDVSDENYYLLEILDVLKDFKIIPDLDVASGMKIISSLLLSLNQNELKDIVSYALSYPPRVRAFPGALIEELNTKKYPLENELLKLKNSLNPFSEYKFGIATSILPTKINWNMK
jgi:hypothetical protein